MLTSKIKGLNADIALPRKLLLRPPHVQYNMGFFVSTELPYKRVT